MALYDKKTEAFFGNSVYVNAEWNEKEEDKWKFNVSSKADTNGIVFTSSDQSLINQDQVKIVFELIMEVKN